MDVGLRQEWEWDPAVPRKTLSLNRRRWVGAPSISWLHPLAVTPHRLSPCCTPAVHCGALLCKGALGSHCPVGDSAAESARGESRREGSGEAKRSQQEGSHTPFSPHTTHYLQPSPPRDSGTDVPMHPQGSQSCTLLLCSNSLTCSLFFPSLPLKGTQDTKFFPLLLLSSPSPLPLIPSTQLRSRGFPFLPTPLPFYYYYYFFNLSFSFNFQGQHGQTMPPVPV